MSAELLLSTFNAEGQWSAQTTFCRYHVDGKGLRQPGGQQADVVKTRAVEVSRSVISEKGFGSKCRYWNTFGSRTLCSFNPRKIWKQTSQSLFLIYIISVWTQSELTASLQNQECVWNVKSYWATAVLVFKPTDIRCLVSPPVCLWTLPDETRRFFWWCWFLIKNGKYNV